ncbi:uncharacterized protein CC84DRAFT_1135894 [Paraphaeosphaeria sporulosa]|uniref:Complex 1 LYR protein domain-containing protein n=1 Tax=Paraphaeosphaeria sporulosa TaxID=1460663 RepID=A0A177D131_9PLEO|nr:uncharacterized protein CC84DRAFT_1135894 [Paraphaeosphaeria sporulosa]OAG12840.1 hypothetical protein CC84DRAFT_1135894 [Paraphaeosphaeria sporulosa]
MPGFLQPKLYIQHRVAAIALYRALLSRCSSANALQNEERTLLHNAIRNKFRQNRKLQSSRQLGLVFKAGYEVLSHLDASQTLNSKSVDALKTLIPSLPRRIVRSSSRRRHTKPQLDPSAKDHGAVLPPEKALLNVRPYAKTNGPRHVPILASANGIPFLRIKKPQPPVLSRVIRQALQRRIDNFHDRILFLNYWIPLSNHEDEWDAILKRECGFVEKDTRKYGTFDPLWVYQVNIAEQANRAAHEKDIKKATETATRMTELIDKETELAIQEGQKIVRGRKTKPIRDRWLK